MGISLEKLAKVHEVIREAQNKVNEIVPGKVKVKVVLDDFVFTATEYEVICLRVIDIICDALDLQLNIFKSPNRRREYSDGRKFYFKYVTTNYPTITLKTIGSIIKRDHATIIHSKKKFDNLFETDRQFAETYTKVKMRLDAMLS